MADAPMPPYVCGTGASGWIDGDHPTVQEGIVNRKVKKVFSKKYDLYHYYLLDCLLYSFPQINMINSRRPRSTQQGLILQNVLAF